MNRRSKHSVARWLKQPLHKILEELTPDPDDEDSTKTSLPRCSICRKEYLEHLANFCEGDNHRHCVINYCDITYREGYLCGGYGSYEYDMAVIQINKQVGDKLVYRHRRYPLKNIRICNTCIKKLITDKTVTIVAALWL